MESMSFDSALYEAEQEAFTEFMEKGVKGLDDVGLITVHALLARCEYVLDKQHRLVDIVEDELLRRMNKKTKFGRW